MDEWNAYIEFRDRTFFPLLEEDRYTEIADAADAFLASEENPAVRFRVISEVSVFLDEPGPADVAFRWAERLCLEFPDYPFAWCRMGAWFCAPYRATPENYRVAVGHYETALRHARAADEWVRYVLFDLCRCLAKAEDWERLEARIREIVADLETKRELDSTVLEDDWPMPTEDGALEPALVARYRRLAAADRDRRDRLGYKTGPATLDELEPK